MINVKSFEDLYAYLQGLEPEDFNRYLRSGVRLDGLTSLANPSICLDGDGDVGAIREYLGLDHAQYEFFVSLRWFDLDAYVLTYYPDLRGDVRDDFVNYHACDVVRWVKLHDAREFIAGIVLNKRVDHISHFRSCDELDSLIIDYDENSL